MGPKIIENPREGIYNSYGIPFHHAERQPLTPENIKYLKENGIIYKSGHFNKEEDELLRENWRRIAKNNNLVEEEIEYFGHIGIKNQAMCPERRKRLREIGFWAEIGKGLEHRCAMQIARRIQRIFDPAIMNGSREILYAKKGSAKISNEQANLVIRMFHAGLEWPKIAKKSGLTLTEAKNVLYRYNSMYELLDSTELEKFFNSVVKVLGEDSLQTIKKLCLEGESSQLNAIFIPYPKLSEIMKKSESACENSWNYITKLLVERCQKYKGKYPEDKVWKKAYKKVLLRLPRISLLQFQTFAKILLEEWHDEDDRSPAAFKLTSFCNVFDVRRRMQEEGVYGFKTGKNSEWNYIFAKTGTYLLVLHRITEKHSAPFTKKDCLQILIRYLDIDMEKYNMPKKRVEKNLPRVYRNLLIECILEYAASVFPDSSPPLFWSKYTKAKDLHYFKQSKVETEKDRELYEIVQKELDKGKNQMDVDEED